MGFFIPGSYEHQGTRKLFHISALESLEYCKKAKNNQFDRHCSRIMWNYFKHKMGTEKMNIVLNPLAPKGTMKAGNKKNVQRAGIGFRSRTKRN